MAKKISNPKGKWGQVKELAKKAQGKQQGKTTSSRTKVPGYSADDLKGLAREYNAKLPKGSKNRIKLNQSAEKLAASLGIDTERKKKTLQVTDRKPPAKAGEAWGKTLDKVEQGEAKPKLSGETKGDFRKQVQEAAKKLTADKPKVEVEKPAPKETIDGLVKAVEAKKKEIKSKAGKDRSTPEGYTRTELYNLAKHAKVPGYSKMDKQQLFDSLEIGKKEEAKKPESATEKKSEPKKKPVVEVKKSEPKKEEIEKPEPVVEVKKPEPVVNIESYPPMPEAPPGYYDYTPVLTLDQEKQNGTYRQKLKERNAVIEEIRGRNYQSVIDAGYEEMRFIEREIDKINADNKIKSKTTKTTKTRVAYTRQDITSIAVLDAYRKKILKSDITDNEAQDFAQSINYDSNIEKHLSGSYKKEDLRRDLASVYQMVGGNITGLNTIAYVDDRAHANRSQALLNIGKSPNSRIIFHEVAHHVEHSLPEEIKNLTKHFLMQKADGQPRPLRELTNDGSYGEDEIAHPDKFLHPYVGKAYPDGSTEVLSMGLEHFTNAIEMQKLYKADPDHFAFILGMLKAANGWRSQGNTGG